MKYTFIKGHRPDNAYDGYGAHNHLEIIALPPSLYLKHIEGAGLVWPTREYADLILNPWLHPWVRQNAQVCGYDWLDDTSAEYPGIYSLGPTGSLHDGIDVNPIATGPGVMVKNVTSKTVNANGRNATAVIYEIDSADMLRDDQCWLLEGTAWIKGSLRDGRAYYDAAYRDVMAAQGKSVQWSATRRSAYIG